MSRFDDNKNIDLNVNNYDIDELLQILDIPTTNEKHIIDASSKLINKFSKEKNTKLENFFEKVRERLLEVEKKNNITDTLISKSDSRNIVNFNNEYNLQNQDEKQLSKWWAEEALVQSDKIQADRNTERKQTIGLFDNNHNAMNRDRLGINQTYNLPVAQGQMNPNLKNVNTRLVNIDSQFRQFSFPAKNGLSFSQLAVPYLSTYSNTDFTLNLTDKLHNVISLKLYSVSIPFTWYNIDVVHGNNCFVIIKDKTPYIIDIQSGNYLPETENSDSPNNIFFAINEAIKLVMPSDDFYITFSYDILTARTKIRTNAEIQIIWYAPSHEMQQIFPNCDTTCGHIGTKANYNLGFMLGFRDVTTKLIYPVENTLDADASSNNDATIEIFGDAIVNLFGPKYLLLVLDDYNQNHLNKGLVSIQGNETLAAMPGYYDPNIPCVDRGPNISEAFYNRSSRFGIINEPRDLQNKNAFAKKLTNAQQTTINGIANDRANMTNNKLQSVTDSDMFAVIPIRKELITIPGEILTETSGQLQINERIYFGPVDIDRFHVKLLTDIGEPLNLNGVDWSFCMIAETLYQY